MNRKAYIKEQFELVCDEAYEVFHERPDLIIFGEVHTYDEHSYEQARSILRHHPEYVLSEGFDRAEAINTKKFLALHKFLTVREIMEWIGLPLYLMNKPEIVDSLRLETRNLFAKISSSVFLNSREEEAKIPNHPIELFDTPLYELPFPAYHQLVFIIKECIEKYGQLYLDRLNYSQQQARLVITDYLDFLIRSLDREDQAIIPIFHAVAKVKAQLVGCDIDKKARPKLDHETEENEQVKVEKLLAFMSAQQRYINDNNPKRETVMGERMAHFTKIRKTDNPIIAIIGQAHLDTKSAIHTILKDNQVKYRSIKQRRKILPDYYQKLKDDTYRFSVGK